MKKNLSIAILALATCLSINASGQSKKIINKYADLVDSLTIIKTTAEQEAADIKMNWSTMKNNSSSDGVETTKDTSKAKQAKPDAAGAKNAASAKSATNAKNATDVKSTTGTKSIPKNKDKAKTDSTKQNTIQTITSNLKKLQDSVPTTKVDNGHTSAHNNNQVNTNLSPAIKKLKDSLYLEGQKKYIALQSSVAGLVADFKLIIKNPSLIKTRQDKITAALIDIRKKQQDLENLYYSGTAKLLKGAGYAETGNILIDVFELGVQVYKDVTSIVASNRQKAADDFEKDCALKTWASL